jgi:hypothetical protein
MSLSPAYIHTVVESVLGFACVVAAHVLVNDRLLGQDRGVDLGGVVAQLEEEGCGVEVGDGERGGGVAVGDGDRVGEGRIAGDGLQQEEIAAGDDAGLSGVCGALQLRERGQADEGGERQPVAGAGFGGGCGFLGFVAGRIGLG